MRAFAAEATTRRNTSLAASLNAISGAGVSTAQVSSTRREKYDEDLVA